MPRNLDRGASDCARCSDDQNLLASLDISSGLEEMQGGHASEGQSRGLLVCQVFRLQRDRTRRRHRTIFGMTAKVRARKSEYRVTRLEPRHILADRFDVPGHLATENRTPWSEEAEGGTREEAESWRHVEAANPPVA
jgi:hypothetical protein